MLLRRIVSFLTRPTVFGAVISTVMTAPGRRRLRNILVSETLPFALVVTVLSFGQPLRLPEQLTVTVAPGGASATWSFLSLVDLRV